MALARPTLEMRWLDSGTLPAEVKSWFGKGRAKRSISSDTQMRSVWFQTSTEVSCYLLTNLMPILAGFFDSFNLMIEEKMNNKNITESSFESQNNPNFTIKHTQEPSSVAPTTSEVRVDRVQNIETEPSDLGRDLDNLLALNRNQSEQLTYLANQLQHQKKSVTYGGIFSLLAIATILGVAASWLLLEFLPPEILTRINGRVNSSKIQTKKSWC